MSALPPVESRSRAAVPLLVPRRPGDPHRDRLWAFCRNWWETHGYTNIVEGDDNDGPFNRGGSINSAAELAGTWDVAVVVDGDVIVEPAQVDAAVAHARATGRLTLAYHRYRALNELMTKRVLDGYDGDWTPGANLKMTTHVSSLIVVPRSLWDETGGFDERFVGWGHDDVAFAQACRVLGGGVDRIPGVVWHLWHEISPERDKKSPKLKASAALSRRYHLTPRPDEMAEFIAERAEPEAVVLVAITDGRRHLAETIPRAREQLKGLPITRTIISDDSGDEEQHAWLRLMAPEWGIRQTDLILRAKRGGFAKNTRTAWLEALSSGQPWVFWLEDDFVIERPVDLAAMADTMRANPHVMQMALRRASRGPAEGLVEDDPDGFTDRDGWLEHSKFWTTNPHLVNRETLARYDWPDMRGSEAKFSRLVLAGEQTCGYWEGRDDAPLVTHVGDERVGTGY